MTDGSQPADTTTVLGEIPLSECWQFLERHAVGRVCVVADGCPVAFPVAYRVLGGEPSMPSILFRTRPGNSISRSLGQSSFEVDEIDMATHQASSVIVRGQLMLAARWTSLPDPHPWILDQRDSWLVLGADSISGRRFAAKPSDGNGFSVEWALHAG